ncbi:regulatory signaling modulator protein AmpE [Solemya velesiana gill symbiont]|nr:regulatory signaling modulator protein AmpE [Solemya velesiana gill symbiont]
MTFFAILISLLLDRFALEQETYRSGRWFDGYRNWLKEKLPDHPLAILLVPVAPLVAIGWFQSVFDSGLSALVYSSIVLLFCLGPLDLDRQVNRVIDELETDAEHESETLSAMLGSETVASAPDTGIRLAGKILTEAYNRLFGVIFWFILLGPLGAALYRIAHHLNSNAHESETVEETNDVIAQLCYLLDWLPARMTALLYAVSGSFEDALHGWQASADIADHRLEANKRILSGAGLGALRVGEEYEEQGSPLSTAVLAETALGLVWRASLVLIGLLALGYLVYWIG